MDVSEFLETIEREKARSGIPDDATMWRADVVFARGDQIELDYDSVNNSFDVIAKE